MTAPPSTAAWLLTYAVHSTVLLGAAALLTARWVRAEAWRDTLWKAALVGGLVTATAQAAVGWSPLGGRVAIAEPAPSAAVSAAMEGVAVSVDDEPSAAAAPIREPAAAAAAAPAMDASEPMHAAATQPAAVADGGGVPLGRIAVVAWAMIALVLLARIGVRQARLQRMLRGRDEVTDPRALGTLAALRRHAGYWRPVRLTVCDACPTPLALGGGEICVPPRFLGELDPEQQRSALAHELAHLARRDPSWHFGAAVLESVFFFQPLNRLARVRLRESAEYLCDEWAARQTGAPLQMARCLAEVASWVAPGAHPIPAGTMAMAEGGSPLARRVERMLDWRGPAPAAGMALRVAAAAVLVAGVAAVAPAVAASAKPPLPAAAKDDAAAVAPTSEETTGDAEAQEVIRHPRPSDPLADRWAWGMEQAARRGGAWVAFSVPTVPMDGAWFAESGAMELSELSRAPVGRMLGVTGDDAILLFGVDGGAVRRIAGRSPGAGMRMDGAPVAWLGGADAADAFAHLRAMADAEREGELREALVEAIAILPIRPAVGEYLGAVLGRDRDDGVRQEAAAGLARHPRGSSKDALLQAIARDGSDGVRREAVEALGRMDYAPAGPELRRLATSSTDVQVRRQAVESLGERGDPEALDALAAAATRDPDPDVRRQAVESLERFPADRAIPALVRIAWPRNDEAARQAAESLGTFADRRAVAALDSLARRHPKDEVARQATESLGNHPSARPLLERIARTHPDPSVREEAEDQLAQHADERRARPSRLESMMEAAFESVDPDPDPDSDPDVNLEPDADPDPDPSP